MWRVLVVDDEPDNVDLVKLIMEFHDVPVITADSGEKCLQILENERPTMLLVDIRMPGMSGFQLLEQLRSIERWRDVPMIALTAQAMDGDRERILEAGFNGYIGKPINAMTLVEELTCILEGPGCDDR
jgi:two-component system cell cycle response regulator DivK